MGRFTDRKNSLKTIFLANNIAAAPTDAAYSALSPGYTTMQLRRTFGSKSRAYSVGLLATTAVDVAPVLAIALVDQNVNEGAALSYQFNAGSFTDADNAITYTAAITTTGAALPGWMTFTPGTRTFSGTAPAVTVNTVISIDVTATDIYGKTVTDTFTVTIVNV
jgi:hypothetical protein